jgi:hypothetical protein
MTYLDEILETNENTKQMRNFQFYYWQEKNDECQDFEITIQATDIKNAIDIFKDIFAFAKIRSIDFL